MWSCEGHNSGVVAESLYANTLSHGHGQTSATVDFRQRETTTWEQIYQYLDSTSLDCRYTAFVSMGI